MAVKWIIGSIRGFLVQADYITQESHWFPPGGSPNWLQRLNLLKNPLVSHLFSFPLIHTVCHTGFLVYCSENFIFLNIYDFV